MARDKQAPLPGKDMPQRDEELEEEGVRLINAKHAKTVAADAYKAAYANVKELLRKRGNDYEMFDAPHTLRLKHRDDEVIIEDKETGSQD